MFEPKASLQSGSIGVLKKLTSLITQNSNVSKVKKLDGLFISAFQHETFRPREAKALKLLQKVASLVLPIMKRRGLQVGILCEFWPSSERLMGQNYSKGEKINLRLRDPHDERKFLPLHLIIDVMLHELAHNTHGDHNKSFYTLWYQLRGEFFELAVYKRCLQDSPPSVPSKSSKWLARVFASETTSCQRRPVPRVPETRQSAATAPQNDAFWRCKFCNLRYSGARQLCQGCGAKRRAVGQSSGQRILD